MAESVTTQRFPGVSRLPLEAMPESRRRPPCDLRMRSVTRQHDILVFPLLMYFIFMAQIQITGGPACQPASREQSAAPSAFPGVPSVSGTLPPSPPRHPCSLNRVVCSVHFTHMASRVCDFFWLLLLGVFSGLTRAGARASTAVLFEAENCSIEWTQHACSPLCSLMDTWVAAVDTTAVATRE